MLGLVAGIVSAIVFATVRDQFEYHGWFKTSKLRTIIAFFVSVFAGAFVGFISKLFNWF